MANYANYGHPHRFPPRLPAFCIDQVKEMGVKEMGVHNLQGESGEKRRCPTMGEEIPGILDEISHEGAAEISATVGKTFSVETQGTLLGRQRA
jgi:hypothetical protein